VLLLDDDEACTDVWREKFQDETSVGVLVANSIAEARQIVAQTGIHIDGVVADHRFEVGKDDPENGLFNGLDFLGLMAKQYPRVRRYALSFYAGRNDFLDDVKSRGLDIARIFPKLFYFRKEDLLPWQEVEKDLLTCWLTAHYDTEVLEESAGEIALSPSTIASYVQRIRVPMRTYLQAVPDSDLIVLKPVEVICIKEEQDVVRATAPNLGLLVDGCGASVSEALDDLAGILATQYEVFTREEPERYVDYAAQVRARLLEHIGRRHGT